MVHSALNTHAYLGNPPASFHSRTQALTVGFNGEDLHIYANHRTADGKFHCYPVITEKPRFSHSRYRTSQRQLRNAQDWSHDRAKRTRDRLWDKSRRDAAMMERRRVERMREDDEDAKIVAGILTPPPSSTRERKHSRRSPRLGCCSRSRISDSPSLILPSVESDAEFEFESPSPEQFHSAAA